MKVLYATGNKAKYFEVERRFGKYGVELASPDDLGIKLEVPETGKTLEANAALKSRLYAARLRSQEFPPSQELRRAGRSSEVQVEDVIIMADDTGLEIDALGGEPGVKARRWRDGHTRMSDEEIMDYCLERLENVPPEARSARFRCVMALLFPTKSTQIKTDNKQIEQIDSSEVEYFDGELRGVILDKVNEDFVMEGYPFEGLFYVPEWEKLLGEVYKLPEAEREKYVTHRAKAVDKALERVLRYLSTQGEA